MKPEKEIQKEIKTLEKMKPKVRQFSMFGDDHHKSIDAQIKVLKEKLDEEDVSDRFEFAPNNVRENAEIACAWLHEIEDWIEVPKSLSEEWESLIIK